MSRFHNQKVIITGGSSGIGNAVCKRLLSEGASVVVWDILSPKENFNSKDSFFIKVDLTKWIHIKKALKKSINFLKKLDILICCAGITGPNKKTWEYTEEEWKYVFDTNVNSMFFSNKACVPLLIENGYGRIVNIASIAGKEGNPNAAAYSSSKAAVIGLTKSLGKELSTHQITVNCITPAAVKTEIFNQMTSDHIKYMLSKIPMGRFGTIDEVSSLICWLASPECSFSTGGVFDISGGRATY
tara:strand:- start:2045 stop:2773 length:729 start_codon:yes stop_codon:yes gene_type:complete